MALQSASEVLIRRKGGKGVSGSGFLAGSRSPER